jgi:thiamine-monophosphate kinase
VLTRRGAKIGDWIYVTGALGGSLATEHHFRFIPRLAEGAWLARHADVRSMMDVSDGLAKDLHALTPSNASPAIEPSTLPCRRGASVRAALTDGEDYELAFALARRADREAFARAWRRAFPWTELTCIGRFVRRGALPATAIDLAAYHGYEHLR